MISKNLIKEGLKNGAIKIIYSQEDGCICAKIGKRRFYFGASNEGDISLEDFLELYPEDTIATMIRNVLNDNSGSGLDKEDVLYYKHILFETSKIRQLHGLLEEILAVAPEEYECSNEENDVYADMANLRDSLVTYWF